MLRDQILSEPAQQTRGDRGERSARNSFVGSMATFSAKGAHSN